MATGRINQIAGGGFARREAGGRTGGSGLPPRLEPPRWASGYFSPNQTVRRRLHRADARPTTDGLRSPSRLAFGPGGPRADSRTEKRSRASLSKTPFARFEDPGSASRRQVRGLAVPGGERPSDRQRRRQPARGRAAASVNVPPPEGGETRHFGFFSFSDPPSHGPGGDLRDRRAGRHLCPDFQHPTYACLWAIFAQRDLCWESGEPGPALGRRLAAERRVNFFFGRMVCVVGRMVCVVNRMVCVLTGWYVLSATEKNTSPERGCYVLSATEKITSPETGWYVF